MKASPDARGPLSHFAFAHIKAVSYFLAVLAPDSMLPRPIHGIYSRYLDWHPYILEASANHAALHRTEHVPSLMGKCIWFWPQTFSFFSWLNVSSAIWTPRQSITSSGRENIGVITLQAISDVSCALLPRHEAKLPAQDFVLLFSLSSHSSAIWCLRISWLVG